METSLVLTLRIIVFVEICFCGLGNYVSSTENREIKVATYNLWNIMFNWDIRKLRIAQMIKEQDPDVVVFQEVRFSEQEDYSQLDELLPYLPQYKHTFSGVANTVSQASERNWRGWEKEGLGIISKMKVINSKVYHIPHHGGPDTNKRIILHAELYVDEEFYVNVVGVHFSYERIQQCHNAHEVLKFITGRDLQNVIVIGDMNTYVDFEWPAKIITDHKLRTNECSRHIYSEGHLPNDIAFKGALKDAVAIAERKSENLTFSNMPTPGYESRPDRIMVSTSFRCLETQLIGNGIYYKQNYYSSILIHRFLSVLHSSYNTYMKQKGFSCLHICGPRGSCRCGICIGGGEKNTCLIPECIECSTDIFKMSVYLTLIFVFLTFHFIYTVVQILVTSSYFSPKNLYDYCGCTCCLCNPKLYRHTRIKLRRKWWQKIWIVCPENYIPPMVLLFILLILYSALFIYAYIQFKNVLTIVENTMDEEFYPSDHLMLFAHLVLHKVS